MNYARIYAAFIDDRKAKQPQAPDYFEKHHIKPRCLGGGDEPENIIRLTPEDHFFAHLLLAKIHGGRLWAPIAFMLGGTRKDWKPTHSRVSHGWAARAMAASFSGQGAHQYDFIARKLTHKDGRTWCGTQSAMHAELGISRPMANMLIKGRVKSAKGWSLGDKYVPRPSGHGHPMYRNEVHHLVHEDGREFVGTQFQFHQVCGIRKADACRLVSGQYKVSQGWRVKVRREQNAT